MSKTEGLRSERLLCFSTPALPQGQNKRKLLGCNMAMAKHGVVLTSHPNKMELSQCHTPTKWSCLNTTPQQDGQFPLFRRNRTCTHPVPLQCHQAPTGKAELSGTRDGECVSGSIAETSLVLASYRSCNLSGSSGFQMKLSLP